MSDDPFDPLGGELAGLLREERLRDPLDPQVSARIRDHVVASVGAFAVGAGVGSSVGAASAKAAGAKAAIVASKAFNIAGVVVAPKVIATIAVAVVAGGLCAAVATKVWTPSTRSRPTHTPRVIPHEPTPAAVHVTEALSAPVAVVEVPAEPVVVPAIVRESSRDLDLATERKLVERARQAVAYRRWDDALSLLEQHRRRFERGRLAEERDSLRVPVLVMLGRHDDARDAAQRFDARYPSSIFAFGVKQAVLSIP